MVEAGMEHLRVSTQELSPGISELRIEGSLDWTNHGKVESALNEVFKRGVYRIVVNLEGAKYISSAGFGCFIGALDTAVKNDGDIIFASAPREILDVFEILGLSKILRFAENPLQAIAQLGKK